MEKKTTFAIGDVVTVQLGNASDTYGYEASVQVEIVGIAKAIASTIYLVRKVDDHDFLAQASRSPRWCDQDLYSTMAFHIGHDDAFSTRAKAAAFMGFKTEAEVDSKLLAA